MPDEEKLSSYLNKSKLISNSNYEKKIRIAILGGFTLNGLEETMRVKCDEKKIQCTTHVSGYNQYNQEILDEKSQLYKFSPDITFLIIDSRNIFGELLLMSCLLFYCVCLSIRNSISKTNKKKLFLKNCSTTEDTIYVSLDFGGRKLITFCG